MSGNESRILAVAAVLACAALVVGLARTDLWPPDEPRVAEMSREMTEGGSWLIPALNGDPFVEEPPLFYWVQAAAYRLAGGASTRAARLPAATAAVVGVLVTAGIAVLLGASPFLAAVVLATAPEYWWMARSATPDTAAAAAAAIALGAFFVAWRTGRRAPLAASAVALAAAFWCKSLLPVGLVVVALVPFVAGAGWGRLRARDVVLAAAVTAVLAATWVLAVAHVLGASATLFFLVTNHFGRLAGAPAQGHVRPALYYLPNLALDFFPWVVVLPAAVAAAWRARAVPERRFALCWTIGMLVVLSLSASKRAHYLLAAYPGLALLVAQWWPEAWCGRLNRAVRRAMVAAIVIAGPVLVLALLSVRAADLTAIAALPGPIPAAAWVGLLHRLRAPGTAWLAAAALAGLGVALVRADGDGRVARTAGVLGMYTTAVQVLLALVVLPRLNPLVSARPGAEHLGRLADRGVRLVGYRFANTSALSPVLFYARRRIPDVSTVRALRAELQTGPTCAVMRAGDWADLTASLPGTPVPNDAFPGFRLTIVESTPGLCSLGPERGRLARDPDEGDV
jgi:4-amino-4-deoxy-L-arabinose transferase-like glycosyltransferase